MGHTSSSHAKPARKSYESPRLKSVQLLLLGPGDSGKTTVFKQLRNSKIAPFTDIEKRIHANGLRLNILSGMSELVRCSQDEEANLEELEAEIEILSKVDTGSEDGRGQIVFTPAIVTAILKLWDSEQIQNVYVTALRHGKYEVQDNYKALVAKLRAFPDWGGKTWVPSDEDCMMWRSPTVGVIEETFEADDKNVTLIDVGGQRGERKKWVKLFEGVSSLIYVCSIAEYDQTLFEADDVNRTVESINLFKSLAENETFKDVAFTIFFNKMDLFIEKFYDDEVPINVSGLFPTAPLVDKNDETCEAAKSWYKDQFIQSLEGEASKRVYYYHFTSALDSAHLEKVIAECTKHVFDLFLGV